MADAWHDFHYTIHGRDVRLIPQLDGSPYGGENCACATAAMHTLSECQGKYPGKGSPWPPTGASFRKDSGDTSGGLLASTVDATLNREYGIDLDFQITTADRVLAKLGAGYGVTQLRWEGPIVDAGFVGAPGFRENHSSFLAGRRGTGSAITIIDCNPLYDRRRASIPFGPQQVPWRAIVRASELLDIGSSRVIDRYGPRMMYVGIGRIPYRPSAPVKELRYSVLFGDGSFYTYQLGPDGRIKSRAAHRFSGPTSAPCGAPRRYEWPGNTARRLVLVSKGVLAGEYVAVPQGSVQLKEREVFA